MTAGRPQDNTIFWFNYIESECKSIIPGIRENSLNGVFREELARMKDIKETDFNVVEIYA